MEPMKPLQRGPWGVAAHTSHWVYLTTWMLRSEPKVTIRLPGRTVQMTPAEFWAFTRMCGIAAQCVVEGVPMEEAAGVR
jgi:hypothetical protein